MGHETADYAVEMLPKLIKTSLTNYLGSVQQSHAGICNLLTASIATLDNSLVSDVLSLLPGGRDGFSQLTDDQIKAIFHGHDSGGINLVKALRAFRGTTALLSLFDPTLGNRYVANLGDSRACELFMGHNSQHPEF